MPIKDEQAMIELKFTQLEKANPPIEETIKGEWMFQIPVAKLAAVIKSLDAKTEVNGVMIHFYEITFAPTVTTLSYSAIGASIDAIEFSKIESADGVYHADRSSEKG